MEKKPRPRRNRPSARLVATSMLIDCEVFERLNQHCEKIGVSKSRYMTELLDKTLPDG